jgi:hypothetical protein
MWERACSRKGQLGPGLKRHRRHAIPRQQLALQQKEFKMKPTSDPSEHNPDKPAMPGEVERDNDALRPNDPAKREQRHGNPDAQETDAQKTARRD